jgi:hypothetical protein
VLADWLVQCGIHSVAMESTSVYWIPAYQILEARGIEVYLVNVQQVKNVPSRNTDVSDWGELSNLPAQPVDATPSDKSFLFIGSGIQCRQHKTIFIFASSTFI